MREDIPKSYSPKKYEDKIYQVWEESGYFNPDNLNLDDQAPSYSIVMPPPNVTGTLHLGHAAMLALEDILIRFYRMRGYRTLWIPGTDHAAIATQTKVEKILKEKGLTRHELGREKFLKEVINFAQNSHNTIVNQIKKMGSSCDWSREAYTLDKTRTKAVRSVFKLMYEDGLIYRGERIVNWCPRCHSTLADDEVEYKEQKAKLYTFRYSADFPFTIATTRPETKLGDTAVAVNPKDERYKKYIGQTFQVNFLGQNLKLKVIADRAVDMDFGTGALGVTPAHSLVDWQMAENEGLNIIKVIDEDGKIKPGFGEFSGLEIKEARQRIVGKLREKGLLEKEEEIDNKISLCYRCDTPIEPLPSKQWFINVNKKIPGVGKSIKELSIEAVKNGVFGRKPIRIYPERFRKNYFHWMENLRDWCISRQIWYGHRIPVWYYKKSKIKNLKSKFIELNFRVKEIYDYIKSGKKIIGTRALNPEEPNNYFGNINPGDEIILNYKQEEYITESLIAQVEDVKTYKNTADLLKEHNINDILPGQSEEDLINLWNSIPGYQEKINKNGIIAIKLGGVKPYNKNITLKVSIEDVDDPEWEQDSDTLDTWFSSGLWTFSTLAKDPEQIKIKNGRLIIDSDDFRYFHPTNVLETAYDILFFWVARMIIMTTYTMRDIPFGDVYLHGLVLDEQGKKMSKSKGNVINPLEMIEKYGTDAVRLSLVIGSAPGNDMKLSEEKIAGFRNLVNKLWNIARFIIEKSKAKSRKPELLRTDDLTLADKWILGRMRDLIKEVSDDLVNYRFSLAGEKLREFTWNDLADWYLEASKFEKNKSKEVILIKILRDLLKLWHPFMPFVTETIWQNTDQNNNLKSKNNKIQNLLMIEKWPETSEYKKFADLNNENNFEIIKNIIMAIRQARTENKIEPSRKIKAVIYTGQNYKLIKSEEILIKSLRTGIEDLEIKEQGEKIDQAIYITVGNIDIYLLGAIDSEKEKARIKKEIENLEKLIDGIKNKLNNEQFINRAPREIVEREKERLANFNSEIVKLREKLRELDKS